MTWTMHAHRYDDGRFHTIGSEPYVRGHGLKGPILLVLVEEVPEDDETATHWGWMRSAYAHYAASTQPGMIWKSRAQFDMCFTYGPEAEVKRGHGRVVRLRITELNPQED